MSLIRRKRHQALTGIDNLLHAVFFDMFGDVKANPKRFNKEPLGKLVRVRSGDFLPARNMDTSGTHAVYGGNGINGRHSSYMFDEPKIIIGRVGVYCGAVHVSEPKSWVTDNALYVADFRSDLDFDYLSWAVRIADLNKQASQAAQPLISAGRINTVEILIPPMRLQLAFKERLAKLRDIGERLNRLASEADTLFASLSQRAFSGEL
jgi:type I restriction enzyme S subunit